MNESFFKYRELMTAKQRRNCGLSAEKKRHSRIILRDNSKCKVCFSENNLSVHHILNKKDFPHFRNEPLNLICLCRNCHDLADKGKLKKDFLFDLIEN